MPKQDPTAASIASTPLPEAGLLLSRDELTELTGTRQAARQRRWLQDRRWPFEEALGRHAYPRVAREVARQHLLRRDSSPQSGGAGLNLVALEAKFAGRIR